MATRNYGSAMIILVDRTNPKTRIVLKGEFAEDDADVLLRTFPELRRLNAADAEKAPPLFVLDTPRAQQLTFEEAQ
jgi:hypothetical protein